MGKNRNGGRPEVADVFRAALKTIKHTFSSDERKVVQAIVSCRTAALGGHINTCSDCGGKDQSYNSCWNRHCPKCQGSVRFEWAQKRSEELLDVPYHQVVFTLPKELEEICYQNKKVCYDLQLKASSRTLEQVAKNNLQIKIGSIVVLHTWDQELKLHPHPHHMVPGGGLSLDGKKWISLKDPKFFLPVRVLSRVYRGKFISYLKKAYPPVKSQPLCAYCCITMWAMVGRGIWLHCQAEDQYPQCSTKRSHNGI